MKKYDFLIVGAGLFGSTCANLLTKAGKKVLVIDKRNHIGGNCFTYKDCNIDIHAYGAHIFHTSNEEVWKYVNQFATFNNFINSPIAKYHNEVYNLPFNMNTFSKIWPDVITPDDAKNKIFLDIPNRTKPILNLEDQAISLVGETIYEKLVKHYTEKQWGKSCKELPSYIIKRLPVRYTYDNNYFNDKYQGIPNEGYTKMIEKMLEGSTVKLNVDFIDEKEDLLNICKKVIYTGEIDKLFHYMYGPLEYRSLRFEHTSYYSDNIQGNAVINYTDDTVPYTRTIEHKHFNPNNKSDFTIITTEYPEYWRLDKTPYYPINDSTNNATYERYKLLSKKCKNFYFGGRLADYKYYDMDDTIEAAFKLVNTILNSKKK